MIEINGINIGFDITSPIDLRRLDAAEKLVSEKVMALSEPPSDETDADYLAQYAEWAQSQLDVFGNFLDDAFGNGVGKKLLTKNPSISKMVDVKNQLDRAFSVHAKDMTDKFSKYAPNRATE